MQKIMIFLTAFALLSACREKDEAPAPPALQNVAINFEALFDGQPLTFGGQYFTLASGEEVRFVRMKFLLSGIHFSGTEAVTYPKIPYAYIDVQGGRLSAPLQFSKTNHQFDRFAFDLGVDSAANHADPNQVPAGHPLDPVVNQLHWGWADGYVYLLLEGFQKHPNGDIPVIFHVGIFPDLNSVEVVLPEISELPEQLNFKVHVDKIFSTPRVYSLVENGTFTHSGQDGGVAAFLYDNFSNAFEFVP
jgi:hypothetical protein